MMNNEGGNALKLPTAPPPPTNPPYPCRKRKKERKAIREKEE